MGGHGPEQTAGGRIKDPGSSGTAVGWCTTREIIDRLTQDYGTERQPHACPDGSSSSMMKLLRQDEEVWNLFTRKEEYENSDRDRFDRLSYYESGHRDVFVTRA